MRAEHAGRLGAAFLVHFRQAALDRPEPPLDSARRRVVQEHLPARRGDDLRDPGTHLTGADHEDPLEAHRSSLPRAASEARRCRSRLTE